MMPIQSVVQFVEGTNIKVLTIIVVLVTDILIVGNSITQPAARVELSDQIRCGISNKYFFYQKPITPIFASAAISGLFAIFYDGVHYFRVKNIPDNNESRLMLRDLGLELYISVDSIKSTARSSLAGSYSRLNIV